VTKYFLNIIIFSVLLSTGLCSSMIEPPDDSAVHSFYSYSKVFSNFEQFEQAKFGGFGFAPGWVVFCLKDVKESREALADDSLAQVIYADRRFRRSVIEHCSKTLDFSGRCDRCVKFFKKLNAYTDNELAYINDDKYVCPESFNDIKQKIIACIGAVYKIHFQVSKKYFVSFVNNLMQLFIDSTSDETSPLHDVKAFKVIEKYSRKNFGEQALPTIVMYVRPLYESLDQRSVILNNLINLFVDRYQHVAARIALRDENGNVVPPRFSARINDLIWIAGGNGDDKAQYEYLIKEGLIDENIIYTNDFSFVRGYEYCFLPEGE